MTPAERDEVRRIADACLCHQDHMSECPCDRCKLASAVLRYVPPADATYRDLVVDKLQVVFCGLPMSPDEAREMAHALHAAADAAKETDR